MISLLLHWLGTQQVIKWIKYLSTSTISNYHLPALPLTSLSPPPQALNTQQRAYTAMWWIHYDYIISFLSLGLVCGYVSYSMCMQVLCYDITVATPPGGCIRTDIECTHTCLSDYNEVHCFLTSLPPSYCTHPHLWEGRWHVTIMWFIHMHVKLIICCS